jgi:hypothetical protein
MYALMVTLAPGICCDRYILVHFRNIFDVGSRSWGLVVEPQRPERECPDVWPDARTRGRGMHRDIEIVSIVHSAAPAALMTNCAVNTCVLCNRGTNSAHSVQAHLGMQPTPAWQHSQEGYTTSAPPNSTPVL